MANAEVTKSAGDNALSLIRKFTRRVQGAGLVKTVRAQRYYERVISKATQKKRAIKKIKRRTEYARLVKEGKVIEVQRRTHVERAPREASQSKTGLGEATPIAR